MKHQFKDQKSTATLVEQPNELVMEVTGDDTHERQPEIKAETIIKKAITGATMVNFRVEPNGSVLMILNEGSIVDSTNTENGWDKVRYDNKTGYIMSKYLKEVK